MFNANIDYPNLNRKTLVAHTLNNIKQYKKGSILIHFKG